MLSLEKISLDRVITCCSADSPLLGSHLDWQVLPKVFHGILLQGIHNKHFAPIHEKLLSRKWVWEDGASYPVTFNCYCMGCQKLVWDIRNGRVTRWVLTRDPYFEMRFKDKKLTYSRQLWRCPHHPPIRDRDTYGWEQRAGTRYTFGCECTRGT